VALSLGLVLGTVQAASAQTSASTSALPDAGVLRLRLGAEDHLRFEPTTGSPSTQSISASGSCRLQLGSPALAAFSATPGGAFPGFFDDGIGVRGSGEGGGQPCGRIDPGQSLTLNLVQGSGSVLEDTFIDFAEIDLEGKFGATVRIDGYFVEGTSATLVKRETYSTGGPDSGPDSADGDNFRVRFPKTGETAVNRLVFSIIGSTGGASLEGGADGTAPCSGSDASSAGCADFSLGQALGTTDTLFHLTEVDTFLDCGDTETQPGDGVPTNSLERLNNRNGDCTPIPINLDAFVEGTPGVDLRQFIVLQKDLLGQAAQFYWTVTWEPETGTYMEDETQFDFGNGYQDLQLCLADANNDGFPELPPTADTGDPASAVDPWCVVETSTELQISTGLVVVTETYYGFGDPGGRR
jgi:hypothetical protein